MKFLGSVVKMGCPMQPPVAASVFGRPARALRALGLAAALSGLAACASSPPQPSTAPIQGWSGQTARAPAPGPADDPWGPYIQEAAARFDVPERWIRAVMRVESGGRTMMNGRPITSPAGAMGLMQVMPFTYEELRQRYGLGPDPYEPRDNILAGTAYLREMYDQFGSPGFLAAYNCGPGCFGEFLAGDRRQLPAETRRYVSLIAPNLRGVDPQRPVSSYAVAGLDDILRTGPAPSRTQVAQAPAQRPGRAPSPAPAAVPAPAPVAVASARPYAPPAAPVQVAQAPAPVPVQVPATALTGGSLRLPSQGRAQLASAGWSIQVGAFRTAQDSQRALENAQRNSPDLGGAQRHIMEVSTPAGQFYRARLVGFASPDQAQRACQSLTSRGTDCMPVSPGA
jgi:cell division protein FtsN